MSDVPLLVPSIAPLGDVDEVTSLAMDRIFPSDKLSYHLL
jgi:hypothetical protein